MSTFVHIARISLLVAVFCSVAFADTHPSLSFLAAEPHAAKAPDAQHIPASKSEKLALPGTGLLSRNLMDRGEAALLSPKPIGAKAPRIQLASKNETETLVRPQLASLAPNMTDHGEGALLYPEPFNRPAMIAPPGETPAKWNELQSRILADEQTLATCGSVNSPCPKAARHFLSIVALGRQRQGRARLGWVNRAVNLSIKPMSDWAQYGYTDFWAAPLQTLARGAGDCEDYAIVKYLALRHLGIAPNDLRLLIVRDNMRQAVHAIVAVRYEQEWLILDNRTMAMLNAEQSRHYFPMFVMDYQGVREFSTIAARR